MKGEGEGKRGGRKRKEIGEGKRMLEGGQGVWFSISKATQTVWRGNGGNAKTKKQKTKNPPEQNKARGGKRRWVSCKTICKSLSEKCKEAEAGTTSAHQPTNNNKNNRRRTSSSKQ